MAMFDSVTEPLRLTVEDGLGKCGQTVECLPDERKALDPIPRNATKETEGAGRKEEFGSNQRTREAPKEQYRN